MNVTAPARFPLLMRANPDGSGHAIEKPRRKRRASPEKVSIRLTAAASGAHPPRWHAAWRPRLPHTSSSMETSNSWLSKAGSARPVGLVVLPTRDGLARHENRPRNLVLGKPALFPLGLQLPSQLHRSLPFDYPLACRAACVHRNDIPQVLQNGADAAVKSLLQAL